MNWEKVPSVTYGGKPCFYIARGESNGKRYKYTVVWNRNARCWVAEYDDYTEPAGKELGCFESATDGRYCAENHHTSALQEEL